MVNNCDHTCLLKKGFSVDKKVVKYSIDIDLIILILILIATSQKFAVFLLKSVKSSVVT